MTSKNLVVLTYYYRIHLNQSKNVVVNLLDVIRMFLQLTGQSFKSYEPFS